MTELLLNILWTLACTVGVVCAAGLFVSLCHTLFFRLLGYGLGYRAVYLTSIVGTPVHELGHAFACILFGHKITEIKLLSVDPDCETLGYVRHTYDKHNLWQCIGNFFIGIAPIYSGSAVLLLGLLLLPGGWKGVGSAFAIPQSVSVAEFFPTVRTALQSFYAAFFSAESVSSVGWWIYVALGLCIALHVGASAADLRHALHGAVFWVIVVALADALLWLIDVRVLYRCNSVLCSYTAFMSVVLSLSVLFSIGLVALAALVCLVRAIVRSARARRNQ